MSTIRKWNGRVTVTRAREHELEQAIADLEKRGYELVRRGCSEREIKSFDRVKKAGFKNGKFEYTHHLNVDKHFAIMQKKGEING